MPHRWPEAAHAAGAHRKQSTLRRAARSVVEALEQRVLMSASLKSISGRVFTDVLVGKKHNHVKHMPLPGVQVYLDVNASGTPDSAEPLTVTTKKGTYKFKKLAPGTYDVVAVPPAGYVLTDLAASPAIIDATKHSGKASFQMQPGTPVVTYPNGDKTPPSAALDAPSLSAAGAAPYRFSVTWSDDTAVDITGFNDGNVVVTGPNNFSQPGNLVALDATVNGSPRTTTYQILAPGGAWTAADSGVYTITLQSGQVRDTLGNADPQVVLGTFDVSINAAIPSIPQLVGNSTNITPSDNSTSAKTLGFRVDNTSPGATLTLLADGAPIGTAAVTGETTTINTDGVTVLSAGPHTFSIVETMPGGAQSASAPATITVDPAPPTALMKATPLTAPGAASYSFTVTYGDATAVSAASLAGANLLVTGPGNFRQTPTLQALDATADGPTRVATYRIAAPGGAFTTAANGNYTVSLLGNQVRDIAGNVAPARVLGTFTVSVGVPLSTAPDMPTLAPGSDTGSFQNDNLTAFDNSAPSRALRIIVTGTIAGATVELFIDGTPSGSSIATSNVTTLLTDGRTPLAGGAHVITARQTLPGQGQSPDSMPLGIVVDTQRPTAACNPPDVNGAGGGAYTFLVVYRDDVSLDVSSFSNNDVLVTGPNGFRTTATFAGVNAPYNGMPRTVAYAITPPGGAWGPEDNGTYTIALQGGTAADAAGNTIAAGSLATFTVNAGIPASAVPAAPVLSPASDSGASSSDRITNLNNASAASALSFTVAGTVAGATVTLYADGNAVGAAVATGAATVVTTTGALPLASGPHTFTARQAEAGRGESLDSPGVTVTIDTNAPAAVALNAANVSAAGAGAYPFTVTYADDLGVAPASLSAADIIVTGPNGAELPVALISAGGSAPATPLVGTYQATPPGGAWDFADNGTYTVTLQGGHVLDAAGNAAQPQTLGAFTVSIAPPAGPAPAGPALSPASDTGPSSSDGLTNLNNASPAAALQFVVNGAIPGATVTLYADGVPIGAAVATGSSVAVSSKGNVPLADGAHVIAATQALSGQPASPVSAGTTITIDTSAPLASDLNVQNVVAAGATGHTFNVEYADGVALDPATFDGSDIAVVGPGNFLATAALVSVDGSTPGAARTVTYRLTPPGGTWDAADSGTYTLVLQASQVNDMAGNANARQTLGTFDVAITTPVSPAPAAPALLAAGDTGASASDGITARDNHDGATSLPFIVSGTVPGATVTVYADGAPVGAAVASGAATTVTTTGNVPLSNGSHAFTAMQAVPGEVPSFASAPTNIIIDTSPPAATRLVANDVNAAGATAYQFAVTLGDDIAIDVAALAGGDVQVIAPGGGSLPTTLVNIDVNSNGTPRVATYQLTPPGGAWSAAGSGTYTIALRAGQVADVAGNVNVAQTLGTFNVNIATPVSPAPAAPALAPSTDSGASSADGITRFNNASAASALQFNVGNTVPGATVTVYADGIAIGAAVASGATTSVVTKGNAPLSDGAHSFTAAQSAPGSQPSGSSAASIVTIDTAAPAANALAAADVNAAGATTYAFTVTFVDNVAIDAASIGDGDVIVAGPSGFSAVATLASVAPTGNGTPRTAMYQFTPPGGTWDAPDSGTYTLALQGGQLADLAGNVNAAQTLGTFNVNVATPVSPAPAAPALTAATDSGASSTDGITRFNNASAASALQFNVGNTVQGATVTVYADGVAIGAAVAPGATTSVVTKGNTPLSDGAHTFTAAQTVPGDLPSGASAASTATIDTTAPAANALSAADVNTSGAATYTFTVSFADNIALDAASFGDGDVVVVGPNGFSATATLAAVAPAGNGTPRTATYQFTPPGGAWDAPDSGTYTLALQPGQLADLAGNVNAAQTLGTFNVAIATPVSPAPAAPQLAAASDSGASSADGVTQFNDASPATALQFIVGSTVAGATVTVYADGAPIGAAVASGATTTVTTRGAAHLSDGPHSFTAAQTASGSQPSSASPARAVTIDTSAPAAVALSAADVNAAGAASYAFAVTYADNVALDAASFGNDDVTVTGPNGFSATATLASVDVPSNGTPRSATYQFTPPGGTWDAADSGTYTLALPGGRVADIAGNTNVSQTLGTFTVAIAVPVSPAPAAPLLLAASDTGASASDGITNLNNAAPASALQFTVGNTAPGATITLYADGAPVGAAVASAGTTLITTRGNLPLSNGPHVFTAAQAAPGQTASPASGATSVTIDASAPAATSLSAADVSTAGAATYSFSVTFGDNLSLNASTFGSGDVTVAGPGGFATTATLVSLDANANGPTRTATYQFTPPGGTWDAADSGAYTLTLAAGQVNDLAGNANAAQTLGTFNVNIAVPISPTPAAPTLAASSDTGASNVDGITNLNNATPASALQFTVGSTVPGATVTVYADGAPIAATVATGGTSSVTSNGSAALPDGMHTITAAQAVPGQTTSAASVGTPLTIDTSPPAAVALSAANVSAAGATAYQFAVTYGDNLALNLASLGNGEVSVAGPGGYSAVATLLTFDSNANGTPRTATYQVTPPGGTWDASDNGSYTIALAGNHLTDVAGNAAAAQTLGTFSVSIVVPATATPAVPVLAAASDTGASSTDGITSLNNAAPASALQFVISAAAPGATVALYADGAPIGSTTATTSTTVVTTNGAAALPRGPHAFTTTQTLPGHVASLPSPALTVTIDVNAPAATSLNAADVSAPGSGVYAFSVAFGDDLALSVPSIGNGDVIAAGPGGFVAPATLVSVDNPTDGTPRTATYDIAAPGGAWDAGENGAYTLVLQAGQVSDVAGNVNAAQTLGAFNVSVAPTVSPAPAAPLLAAVSDTGASASDGLTNLDNVSPAAALQFNVANTIAGATITLYADGAPIGAALAAGSTTTVTTGGNATLANGAHAITARQTVPGQAQSPDSTSATITVDTSPPAATALSAPDVASAGATAYAFDVTYGDNIALDEGSLDGGDIVVTGPNGFTATVTFATSASVTRNAIRLAHYQFTPPGGAWDAADNGTYTFTLQPNQLRDAAGNSAAQQTLGTFVVNVPLPASPAPAAPALLAVSDSGASQSDAITNLNNASPAASLQFTVADTVPGAEVTLYANGSPVATATAAGASTDVVTDGSSVLLDGALPITATQTVPGATTSAPSPVTTVTIDTTPPRVTAVDAPDVDAASGGATEYTFTVTFADAVAVNLDTLNGAIAVSGPNGFAAIAALVSTSASNAGTSVVATYRLTPPDGAWAASANGGYTVALQPSVAADLAGNLAPAAFLGVFTVNVP